ncbi:MAG: excinuclease ABC subunit B, partial [Deltaproteobacteria bacterium]|nr:excinuclease ABC subunit B [Deltaproteobacteria bacterium]
IQIFGRASRNVFGRVIMYAEKETASMKKAMSETKRRQKIQKAYNEKHHIVPTTIQKNINLLNYPTQAGQSVAQGSVDEDIQA